VTRRQVRAADGGGIAVGRFAGTPVVLGYSWLFLAAIMIVGLGPNLAEGFRSWVGYALAAGYGLILLLSVFLHEAAHAVVGNRLGHRTEKIVLTFLGGHTNLAGPLDRKPANRDLLIIALAGPMANLAMAIASGAVMLAVAQAPSQVLDTLTVHFSGQLLWAFFWSNLLLGVFNLLPGLPLDGGQIVESIVWSVTGNRRKGTTAAAWAGVVIGCGIIALAVVLLLTQRPLVVALGAAVTGVFIAYAGWQQLARIPLLEFVDRWDIYTRMHPVVGEVRSSDPIPASVPGLLAVVDDGRIVGYLDPVAVTGPLVRDSMVLVSDTLERASSTQAVLQAMGRPETWAVAISDRGRCVGVLTQADLQINEDDIA
jgi:Zn-dependent protease